MMRIGSAPGPGDGACSLSDQSAAPESLRFFICSCAEDDTIYRTNWYRGSLAVPESLAVCEYHR